MARLDFDFARYVKERKGAVEQRARDGAVYSFIGDRKLKRTLASGRPVLIALEGTNRLWHGNARESLLADAVRVTDQQYPRVLAAAKLAARILAFSGPDVYVLPASEAGPIRADTLGTDDEPYVLIADDVVDELDDAELAAIVAQQFAHVQNNHVGYSTALHYLTHSAMSFVRWTVRPAIMALQAWHRRAIITCDRAALLTTRNLDVASRALVKVNLALPRDRNKNEGGEALNVDEYLANVPDTMSRVARYAELFHSNPYLPKRLQALALFAEGKLFQALIENEGGKPADEVDAEVSQLLSVF